MINQTYEEVFTYEALYKAHLKGRTAKRDKKPLVRFEMCMLSHIYEVYRKLHTDTFKFGSYSAFVVYEPKRREIQTLHYSARIVQHVLCDNLLMPYFSKRAIMDNCVCQIGKGTKFALGRFEGMLRTFVQKHKAKGYFLKCDVLKYFPSVPHEQLKQTFCTPFKDKRLKNLIEGVIDSYHTSEEYLNRYGIPLLEGSAGKRQTGRGMPIGNQTSQVFGMFYLNKVDRLIKEKLRIKAYSRYMDDFVIIHHDKEYLKYVLKCILKAVGELGLSLNSKTQIFPLKNGVTYLGFRYFVTDSGKIIKNVKKQTKRRMRWRARLLKKAYFDGVIDAERVQLSLASINGHLKYGNTYKLRAELFKKLSFIANDGIILRYNNAK
ncbi:MAG: RNA-directed DNA polymerase [Clostridia bacterium]|nr:RNA-directed DNA polymerase [Clostridia bacterium]